MHVSKVPFPAESLAEKNQVPANYTDSYYIQFYSEQLITIDSCIRYIFYNWPGWILFLIKLRNILVKPFGLASSDEEYKKGMLQVINITKGGKVAFFKVIENNDEEVLLGFNDKHLDGYLLFRLKKFDLSHEVLLTTVVKYNNNLGRIYFFIIKPFHKIIIISMLSRLANYFTYNIKNQKL